MDVKFSKRQYDIAYFGAKERNCRLYPPYCKVLTARKRCYPPSEFIHISELGFKIDLQAVLDLTASRLVETFPSQFDAQVKNFVWYLNGVSMGHRVNLNISKNLKIQTPTIPAFSSRRLYQLFFMAWNKLKTFIGAI